MLLSALFAAPAFAACPDGPEALCLGERFTVEVSWRDFGGGTGAGMPEPLTSDTGTFWFFDPANVELVVKVLDGRTVNGHFWVFYGSLSNVEFDLTVTDTVTGATKTFHNDLGHFASEGDTRALPGNAAGVPVDGSRPAPAPRPQSAGASAGSLLLGDRFRVDAAWRDFQGGEGRGTPVPLTSDTGAFWFFDPANVELVVKVLDGRPLTGHFWVFYGALSNVEFTLTVTDTSTGVRRTYRNPPGRFASVGDTGALTGRALAGVGFSPRFFASVERPWTAPENVRAHFAELEELGLGLFGVHGEWWGVAARDGALDPGLATLLETFPKLERRLVAHLQFADPATGLPLFEPGTAAPGDGWEQWEARGLWGAYAGAAEALARRQRPPFLGVGVEINEFARRFPGAYDRFAREVFPDIVARVREASPDTVVFPGFQFEQLIGDLRGAVGPDGEPGCPGCVPPGEANSLSGRTHPDLTAALNRFPPDALTHLGFTTYPHFNRDFETPADLPGDYYRRLLERLDQGHRDVHLVWTESGWPANEELTETEACVLCTLQRPGSTAVCFPEVEADALCTEARIRANVEALRPWLGSPAEQLAFVERFSQLVDGIGGEDRTPALVFWTLLHDADGRSPAALPGLFTHTGLRSHDGTVTRPAFGRWLELWVGAKKSNPSREGASGAQAVR